MRFGIFLLCHSHVRFNVRKRISLGAYAPVDTIPKHVLPILTLTVLVTTIDALQHFETG